jgi:glycosyltransferase involved in cell wall biosynthesis
MPPVRVAFDCGPLHGTRTGVGVAVAALRDALASCPDVELRPYLLSFRSRPEAGTTRLPLPAAAALRWWAHAATSRATRPMVDRWLGNVEVVHGTNYVAPPSRRPRLISVYDTWFLRQPDTVSADVRRRGQVLRRGVDEGAHLHTSSGATASALAELFPGAPIHTIPLGAMPVPPSAEQAPIAAVDGHPFIVAIGRTERRKNLPMLIDAFGLVADAHADVHLVLAGPDGNDGPAIDRAILRLAPDASRRVHLAGWVDAPTRGWLLRHAAVLAYPSLDEGFGFPLLDAMQVGLPIVASSAGSIPELVADAALLAAPTDTEALAAHLQSALEPDVAAMLATRGSARWQHFDWAVTADAFQTLYRQLAEENQ